ncbi:hypothetical protein PFISCL1PPCAC_16799, partial [Pristionchus fissidentatus]
YYPTIPELLKIARLSIFLHFCLSHRLHFCFPHRRLLPLNTDESMAGMKKMPSEMVEDYHNGLKLVPLESRAADHFVPSTAADCTDHPWRALLTPRVLPPSTATKPPETQPAPATYYGDAALRAPAATTTIRGLARQVEVHETIRLKDVEAFRQKAAKIAYHLDNINDPIGALTARLYRLSTVAVPVIYRYIDVIENNIALLEAIHFEIFLPDRPDLRFLGVPFNAVPSGTIQGDYCNINEVALLQYPSFSVSLGRVKYPVIWEAKRVERMEFDQEETTTLAVIIDKRESTPGVECGVSLLSDRELQLRATVFDAPATRAAANAVVRVTTRMTSTAHLHPVEPLRVAPPPATESEEESNDSDDSDDVRPGVQPRRKKPAPVTSEYAALVRDVRTSQRPALCVSAVSALGAAEAARIDDRLGAYGYYGRTGDLFLLGSTFRVSVARKADTQDTGEYRVDESVILRTMREADLSMPERCRPLLESIYGHGKGERADTGSALITEKRRGREAITLNKRQSRAVREYVEQDTRVYCILSPPGSGKTTVAAAMAAAVARDPSSGRIYTIPYHTRNGKPRSEAMRSVQLLISVQNVAVDNMGTALLEMDYGGGEVYNMKSTKRLDPFDKAPFDLFDGMNRMELKQWQDEWKVLDEIKKKGKESKWQKEKKDFEERLTTVRRETEKTMKPRIILATVEMVLMKLFTPSALCTALACVDRIIIDESSLLTEAALYCIIRRFPKARIVLIGDDKQLPPFMYDEKVLGHELAGRPALSVALKNEASPVIRLTEVYRAPPSLVEPYNRLSYGRTLKSRKPEGAYPLSDIGLMHYGRPQLLFIDVNGMQERDQATMSLCNEKEAQALVSLLKKFPNGSEDKIMIICLYKQQKRRLHELLDKKYTVLTVDSSQGKEKPIVILLTTRTVSTAELGFFSCEKRCNVSISRQQSALIIMGKSALLTKSKPWSTVINENDFTRIEADSLSK